MSKNVKIALVAVLFIGMGAVWFIMTNEDSQDTNSTRPNSTNQATETSQPADNEDLPEVEEIELVAQENYEGNGVATRTLSGTYVHTVTADIDPPAQDKFYEGWIVGGPDGFISTGKLSEETDGVWSLSYSSDKDMSAYNQVVITEETEANGLDNVPEDHVLEGSF